LSSRERTTTSRPWTTWPASSTMRSKGMRSQFGSLLDPLFDRKIFVAMCLAGTLSLVMYLIFGTLGLPPESAPESAEVVPNLSDFARAETPYEQGFRTGYSAFLKQTGQYIPRPGVSASYASSYSSDDEDVSRGYVDGYHKATEMEHCPGGYFK
jgi:hypothetical protein